MKPIILDCFSGAGGMARGLQQAGFYVVGIDNRPMPRYGGDEFHQDDALDVLRRLIAGETWHGYALTDFAGVHASPPCQKYSVLRNAAADRGSGHPDLVEPTRVLLLASGLPYVIENVAGAPLNHFVVLCGSMFGLGAAGRQLRRHRLFETSFPVMSPPCQHKGEAIGVYGGGATGRYTFGNGAKRDPYGRRGAWQGTADQGREAMGIAWMTHVENTQAIPPAYGQHIGEYLMLEVLVRRSLPV